MEFCLLFHLFILRVTINLFKERRGGPNKSSKLYYAANWKGYVTITELADAAKVSER